MIGSGFQSPVASIAFTKAENSMAIEGVVDLASSINALPRFTVRRWKSSKEAGRANRFDSSMRPSKATFGICLLI